MLLRIPLCSTNAYTVGTWDNRIWIHMLLRISTSNAYTTSHPSHQVSQDPRTPDLPDPRTPDPSHHQDGSQDVLREDPCAHNGASYVVVIDGTHNVPRCTIIRYPYLTPSGPRSRDRLALRTGDRMTPQDDTICGTECHAIMCPIMCTIMVYH
jgi:hypothetical protein